MRIRAVGEHDIDRLRDIERAAGAAFAEIDMLEVAGDEPPSPATLTGYQRQGRAWAQVDDSDWPVAYLIADVVDGAVHIEQVSVDPAHAGGRLGLGLIEHVAEWARLRGFDSLTLTTFTNVAWNAPYYERCGFRVVVDSELTPGLRRIRAEEAESGLDRWPRTVMRRELQPFSNDQP